MPVVGIHHVQLNVRDIDEAALFYVDRLGFTRADMPAFDGPVAIVWLNAGDTQLHLIRGTTPAKEGQHFALQMDDLDACIDDLRRHGIEVGEVMVLGVRRQATLFDPSGNQIEINEIATAPAPAS